MKESGLVIDLLLRRQSAPIAAATEELYRSRRDQSYFAWNVALPRAQASGVIDLDDRHIEVRGGAYHDHNWGTVVFRRHFRKWIWMRIFFEDFTFIFSEIDALDLDGPPLRPLIFTDRRGRPIATGRPTVEYRPGEQPGQGPLRLPRGLKIGFTGGNAYSVEIEPDPDMTIQEAPSGGFSALWLNAGVHYSILSSAFQASSASAQALDGIASLLSRRNERDAVHRRTAGRNKDRQNRGFFLWPKIIN